MPELPKTYDPTSVEPKWYARWIDNHDFEADANSPKPSFSIVMPPPNITGVLTLGHVLNNTIQDILARRARMRGFEVLWLPGTDHAGLATQTTVEKHLRRIEKKTRHDLGREEFLRRVLEWQDKYGGIIIEQLKRLGCSCDWSRQRYTFDNDYSRAVRRVFVELFRLGLVYRSDRIINWDPAAQTALSDEEVVNKPQRGHLYFVRYEIVEQPGRSLEVATTRPETIMADTAVAVHPSDRRYVDLIGKHVWRPLAREKLPIIPDEAIDPEFGTGVLKVTPAHDKVDFGIGARHKLPIVDVLTPDGRINCPAVPELHGLDRFEARKKAAELLEEGGALFKTEPYENTVGFSDRSDVPIEPRVSQQWFLQYPKTKEALAVVRDHLVRFFPAHWEKVYAQWIENIQDWCISRQVWWGHRIPVWRPPASANEQWVDVTVPEVELRHLEVTTDLQKAEATSVSLSQVQGHTTLFQVYGEMRPGWKMRVSDLYAATSSQLEAGELERRGWIQDPDTLDTWFSSWLWAYETMDEETRKKFYPTSVLVTAADIIFFWVARMIIAGLEFKPGQSDRVEDNIPFRYVYFTGLIRDKQGRKMSKSLGNSPDPLELIDKYGADGLRLGVMRSAPLGADILFDEKNVELGRNFCTKLWNAVRLREMQGGRVRDNIRGELLTTEDKWIVCRLDTAVNSVTNALNDYQFSAATNALHIFVWSEFCDWYLEAAKAAFNSTNLEWKTNTLAVIDHVLSVTLRLLHPFLPFITEELWNGIGFGRDFSLAEGGRTVVFAPWPSAFSDGTSPSAAEAFWLSIDPSDDSIDPALHTLVNKERSIRRQFGVPSNKRLKYVLWLRREPPPEREIAIMKQLLRAESLDFRTEYKAPKGTPHVISTLGYLYPILEPDVAAERGRLEKEITKVEEELRAVEAKLKNKSFVDRAPATVVEEHRQRQKNFAEQLAKLKHARDQL